MNSSFRPFSISANNLSWPASTAHITKSKALDFEICQGTQSGIIFSIAIWRESKPCISI